MIKLSIVIPAYNAEPYIDELMERLDPQITPEVEVVIVDDGSRFPVEAKYDWIKLHRFDKNRGLSAARNKGLEMAQGEVIHFVDADDMVPENYVQYMLSKIYTEDWDYIDLSWKSMPGGIHYDYKLNNIRDKLPNPSASTRAYKRAFIGDVRFNEKKDASEDEDFNRRLDLSRGIRAIAEEYMYFYRTQVPNSNSKRIQKNARKTKRIAYYYAHVTADMTWLLEEVKKEDEVNEVFILTHQNDIPELERYAHIWHPSHLNACESRGEPNMYIHVIPEPIRTQVCIYTHDTYKLGGLETFIYNWVMQMKPYYDIMVLYDVMDPMQINRLREHVPVIKNDPGRNILCDTLLMNRVFDMIPNNIIYDQSYQIVHGCRDITSKVFHIPTDRNKVICVSNAVKESFGEEAKDAMVIHNITYREKTDKALLLVTASRLDTPEKGQQRMLKLAKEMKDAGIKFIWLVFTNKKLANAPEGMVFMPPTTDIKSYIARADYLVQLSDSEAFCYSIVEALELGTAIIATDLPVLKELKIENKKHGYIYPMDMQNISVKKLLKIPKFKYFRDNKMIIEQWREVLGDTEPLHDYQPGDEVAVRIKVRYNDIYFKRVMEVGEVVYMPKDRAENIIGAAYGEEV